MILDDELLVAARFNGPPNSGNGGYTAGLLASRLTAGPATVTLRQPPPLATPMRVSRPAADTVELRHHADLVASAVIAAPPPHRERPGADLLDLASSAAPYAGFTEHPFPTCYVCGPERAPSDGLRIFPGRLADGRTIAGWSVPAAVDPVTVWAALDCPGGWAIIAPGRPYVLGRITVTIDDLPAPGTECVIVGECTGTEGRKGFVTSELFTADGVPLARSAATWIAIPG